MQTFDSPVLLRLDAPPDRALPRLVAATFTPLCADGTLDLNAISHYAALLAQAGVRELFVNGTTGESLSLSVDERLQLVELWCRHWPREQIIVHVGHNCQADCIRMAAHAAQHGVAGISAMPTTFFRSENVESLLSFLGPIAAAAPGTKFYYYHIPSMAPVNIDVDTFLTAACEQMPTLAGIKFTHDNLLEFGRLQARWGDRLEVLFGRDELLLPAIALGAQGAVGSFYGLTPNVFRQIWHCAAAGAASHAIEWSLCSNQLIDMCRKVGVPAAGKAMLASRGIGSGALRSPQLGLDADANRWLFSELANIKWPRAESPRSVPPPVGLPRGRADAVSTPER